VDRLIEKPGPDKAPSNLAVVSGYVLTPEIFPILSIQKPGKGGDIITRSYDELAKKHPYMP
jgi:UTP--glucose-1-phosphate uridylyltransferase